MSSVNAWTSGLGRVGRAPFLVLALWLCTLAITVPPALALHGAIVSHLGESLEADAAADGVNYDWMQEFTDSAGPIGRTLQPDVIGFGAVMNNTSALADVTPRALVVVIAALAYVFVVWFLTPGIIHRLASDRPMGAQRFFSRCGACAARLLRLSALSTAVYAALFLSLHVSMFDDLFGLLTRNTTVERTAVLIRFALYLVLFAVVASVNMLFDLAKVRMIVEDRHSVVASLAAAARFIGARPALALGVYALNLGTLAAVLGMYYLVAPGAGSAGWTMWGGFVVSQAYIAGRIITKLSFWAGEAAALQGAFKCPGFVRGSVEAAG